jgi:hypothetical protein
MSPAMSSLLIHGITWLMTCNSKLDFLAYKLEIW